MKKCGFYLFYSFFLFICSGILYAGELVYTPINPSFGGSSFNASWLQQQANEQNTFKEPTAETSVVKDPLEDFKDSVNRQILNRLASQFTRDVFGEDALEPGHYELGNFIIDVIETIDGVQISIKDITTGNETTILVPYL